MCSHLRSTGPHCLGDAGERAAACLLCNWVLHLGERCFALLQGRIEGETLPNVGGRRLGRRAGLQSLEPYEWAGACYFVSTCGIRSMLAKELYSSATDDRPLLQTGASAGGQFAVVSSSLTNASLVAAKPAPASSDGGVNLSQR